MKSVITCHPTQIESHYETKGTLMNMLHETSKYFSIL